MRDPPSQPHPGVSLAKPNSFTFRISLNLHCVAVPVSSLREEIFANDHDVGGSHIEEHGIILIKNISEKLGLFFAVDFQKELDELK